MPGVVDFFGDGSCVAYYPLEDHVRDITKHYNDIIYDSLAFVTWPNGRRSANIGKTNAGNINIPLNSTRGALSVFHNHAIATSQSIVFYGGGTLYFGGLGTDSAERWCVPGEIWPPTRVPPTPRSANGNLLVWSFDNNIVTFFIGNILQFQANCSAFTVLTSIGVGNSGTPMNYSELRVFNRPLMAAEVAQLAANSRARDHVIPCTVLGSILPTSLSRGFR